MGGVSPFILWPAAWDLIFRDSHNNSLPASGKSYCLLIILGNNLDPDQAQTGSKLLFDTLMLFLESIIFEEK